MKKILLGSVALIVMSVPVLAADMPVKAAPLPPAWSWTGCYVGLNVGYGWARFRKSEINQFATATGAFIATRPDFDFDDDGALGGGQIGCNWQYGLWVWGLETDLQVTSIEARDRLPGVFGNTAVGGGTTFFTEAQSALRWFGTARARAGWTVWPTTLLYVTGGFAYGRVNSHLGFGLNATNVVAPSAVNFDDQYHYGWTVGVGVESKITQNFTAKLEYLYVDLGSADYAFNNIAGTGTVPTIFNYTWSQRTDFHVVRLGLNYQFNWYETVVAKY
jgi:outer membrane immunogenic protein